MVTPIGFSGSLRQGSFNASLLRAAAQRLPEGAASRIATMRGIALVHLAALGRPRSVRTL